MKKIKYLLDTLDLEQFQVACSELVSIASVGKGFGISDYCVKRLCEELNISVPTTQFVSFNEFKDKVSPNEFISYWNSHSKEDTTKHFNIGPYVFSEFKALYNIEKDEQLITDMRNKTCELKYNVSNVSKLDEVKSQIHRTKVERYGEDMKTVTEKMLKTRKERYGDTGYHNIEKMKQTNLGKFGAEFALQAPEILKKVERTKLRHFGDAHYNNIQKAQETDLQRYGVTCIFASPDDTVNGRETQRNNAILKGEF